MSIISPSWSGTDLVQALGRIHRAGSKSPAIQKIIYCAKTYEEQICALIRTKLKNLSAINDGDLIGPNYPIEKVNQYNEVNNIVDDSHTYKALHPNDK